MAVYTEVDDDALEAFLAEYDIGELRAYKGIAEGVENTNYYLETDRGRYILTLYEKRVAPQDLPFFLGLMDHLAAKGVACPTPVHGRDGKALRELCGRPAAIVTFLVGVSQRRVKLGHCAPLGDALARLHAAARDYDDHRTNSLSLAGWRPLFEKCAPRAHEVQAGLAGEVEAELVFLERHWPTGLPSGVIHADLFPDNVFFLGDEVSGLIDFYFACNDYLAYDTAICVNAWCFESDGSYNVTKARALIGAYHKVRALMPEERKALPLLLRGSALRFLLTRLHDWLFRSEGALVTPHNPLEYLRKLRFHQGVKRLGELGIAA
ncbi:MAG: homoserine kinase [Rhodospirillaceae bacterium]|nr:homoserine kinase [Rhodospirillaceae bacterium]